MPQVSRDGSRVQLSRSSICILLRATTDAAAVADAADAQDWPGFKNFWIGWVTVAFCDIVGSF